MGLIKPIELPSGVVTNYHRIVSMNVITNVHNVIEIASYTSQEKRNEEKKAIANGIGHNVFISTKYISADYNQNMTIQSTYNWLKTLPDFEGSVDA